MLLHIRCVVGSYSEESTPRDNSFDPLTFSGLHATEPSLRIRTHDRCQMMDYWCMNFLDVHDLADKDDQNFIVQQRDVCHSFRWVERS